MRDQPQLDRPRRRLEGADDEPRRRRSGVRPEDGERIAVRAADERRDAPRRRAGFWVTGIFWILSALC